MEAWTVGTKRDASKATSRRSDDGVDGSWNGRDKVKEGWLRRKRLERGGEEAETEATSGRSDDGDKGAGTGEMREGNVYRVE